VIAINPLACSAFASGKACPPANGGYSWLSSPPLLWNKVVHKGTFCLVMGAGVPHGLVQGNEQAVRMIQSLPINHD
jgi:hypothetical protein